MSIDKIESATKSQLAIRYKVSRKTMTEWLKRLPGEIGIPWNGYFFTPLQVKKIYEKLDAPEFEKDEQKISA